MSVRLIACAFISLVLLACAATGPRSSVVEVAAGVTLRLTAAPAALNGQNWSWRMTITPPGQVQRTLLAQMAVTDDKLDVVMMTPAGLPLLSLEKQGDQPLKARYFVPRPEVQAESILADIQLAHWPAALVNSALKGGKLVVKQNERQLINARGERVMQIRQQGGELRIEHQQRGYQIRLAEIE